MLRILYSLIWYLSIPLVLLKLWRRGAENPDYRLRWAERFGFYGGIPAVKQQLLWVHSVSVGETIAIAPLVERLLAENPDQQLLITTMTPTGSAQVKRLFGERVLHVYCPYDLLGALSRFHRHFRPRACVVVETELWPNLIHSCARRNLPVILANARLSARSARGYQRISALTRPMLNALHCVAVQNPVDGQRFIDLGLAEHKLQVTGSIKFDIDIDPAKLSLGESLRQQWGEQRPVWVAASTHDAEHRQIAEIHQQLLNDFPDLLLVLVPRHPEQFAVAGEQCQQLGLTVCRRSGGEQPETDTQVFLGDTLGEMLGFYAAADIAFVGGSLIERGGHNPLEPALLAKPLLVGPHYFNFQQITDQLQAEGGLAVADNPQMLRQKLTELLQDSAAASAMGQQGKKYLDANRGALQRLIDIINAAV